jgi:type VI secretion system protein ImpK
MASGPKQPFENPTLVRGVPRPGEGRVGTPEAAAVALRAVPPPEELPASASISVDPAELRSYGPNRLVGAAMPLISLMGRLRTLTTMPNLAQVRQQAIRAVRTCEDEISKLGYPQEIQLPARYVLCTAVDQSVLSTPWGAQSEWAAHGLLITFHHEAWGGETFFKILEWARAEPARYIDLLELQYICLSLGFAGMYLEDPGGSGKLAELRDDVYRRIRDVRGAPPEALSVHWEGERDKRRRLIRYIPLWIAAAVAALVVLGFFIVYFMRLNAHATPTGDALARIGVTAPEYTGATEPASTIAQTLKQRLAQEINAEEMSIEETDKGTLVSLTPGQRNATELFATGSDTLNAGYTEAVRRLGKELDAVPGRVLILGHTDDQPIRSLRYADNLDLSRARADSVRRILSQTLRDPARITTIGVGSAVPRYKPPEVPGNRKRNRRVEILLQKAQ